MQAGLIKFEIIILNIYYENEEIIKKGVPQSAKISKLERIWSKFPSQLEFGGEQLFWGTARGVLFCFERAGVQACGRGFSLCGYLNLHVFYTQDVL